LRQYFYVAVLQRPIDFGVDIVVHSTTKYLNGHSDSIGGFVALNDEEDAEWIRSCKTASARFFRRSIRFWFCAARKR
jgi:cystathionine beta-lyase/cystathionine gamma-synthase